MTNVQEEIWKPIPGHPKYSVSNLGNIKGCYNKLLRPQMSYGGYYLIMVNGKGRALHRWIAITFIPNPENKPQVNHINGIKTDNRVENLEWCTASENKLHAHRTGLTFIGYGEKSRAAKLTRDKVSEVFELRKSGLTHKQISNIFNVARSTISWILAGSTWKQNTL